MGRVYKTARGKTLDMASLMAQQEKTRAVSNINAINSRGDEIDSAGNIIKPNTQRVAESYASQVKTEGAVSSAVNLRDRPENPNISKSANPNAPLSPKQKRELEALESGMVEKEEAKALVETPMLDKLVEESKPEPSVSEHMQAELEPIDSPDPIVAEPVTVPDTTINEAELHPEEAELAELEEDFDIEAIKKEALANIISEPEPEEEKKSTPKTKAKKKKAKETPKVVQKSADEAPDSFAPEKK